MTAADGRSSEHISDLRWDRWLAGELPAADAAAADAHAAICAPCTARRAALTAERDGFAARPIAAEVAAAAAFGAAGRVSRQVQQARRRRGLAAAGISAIAAAAVIAIVIRGGGPAPAPPGTIAAATKGAGDGVALLIAAGRPPGLVQVATGDAVHPGDSLQIGYTSQRAGFGAVLSLDGAGTASIYVPAAGEAMVALPPGDQRSFPSSTVLDGVLGRERVVALWCPIARPIAPLLGELRATGGVTAPAGCHARQVVLDKREAR